MPRSTHPTPDRETLIDALAVWHATPKPLRQIRSLNQLAGHLGVAAGGRFYELAHSPEVYQQMLVKTAGDTLQAVPHILHTLMERAKAGHVGAAKVYLDFLLQVLTDERIFKKLNPKPTDFHKALGDTSKVVAELLAFAKLHAMEGQRQDR